jgi:hypothetical protein
MAGSLSILRSGLLSFLFKLGLLPAIEFLEVVVTILDSLIMVDKLADFNFLVWLLFLLGKSISFLFLALFLLF